MKRGRPPHPGLLTPREQEVQALLRQGLSNRQIADRLQVSYATAAYHVSEIISKLGVSDRAAAAAWQPDAPAREPRRLPLVFPAITALRSLPLGAGLQTAALGAIAVVAGGVAILALGVFAMDQREEAPFAPTLAERPLGTLAYVDDGDLWTLALPDGPPQRLTHDGRAFAPRWSASGEWLLFQKTNERAAPEVCLMRADGNSPRELDAFSALWSPVDDRVAYITRSDRSLVVEDATGTGRLTLFDGPSNIPRLDGAFFQWSPDGDWLALTVARRNSEPPLGSYVAIRAYRADGTETRELLARYDVAFGLLIAGWTPDSRSVIYSPDPSFSASYIADGLQWHFAALDPQENLRREGDRFVRTDTIDEEIDNRKRVLRYDDFVDFAPDRTRLVTVRGGGRDANANKAIAVVEDTGTLAFRDLTAPEVAATSPSWSPDDAWIAYVQQPAGGQYDPATVDEKRIWLMRPNGSGKRPLTGLDAWEERPRWSADGRHILYVSPSRSEATAALRLRRVADGVEQVIVAGIDYETNSISRNIGYYGHLDWDRLFDWWQP